MKAKYLENLKNQLRIDPKLVYARSTLSRSADEFGWTGLHFAAKENNIDMIEVLLSCKADPMSIDVRGAQHYILPQRVIAWKRVSALCGPFKTPMMGKNQLDKTRR